MYREWSARFLLFARQQTRTHADAEDVLQDALVHVWSKREVFPTIDPGLVFTHIRRLAVDHSRRNQRRETRESRYAAGDEPDWFDPRKPLAEKELESCLRQLPPEQQEVLVLKIWGEQTFESVGETLDISPNTAASRYRYGLERLKRILSGEPLK